MNTEARVKQRNKNRYLLITNYWLLLTICACLIFSTEAKALLYEDISACELKQRIDDDSDGGYIILDIREVADYEEGHIPKAINIPLKELGYRLFTLDKTKDIIVYCQIGQRSKIACEILTNAGFKDVYNLTDGLKAWDYALQTSDGRVSI